MSKKGSIGSGLAWSFGERITAQLVTTVVGIVLARLLDPAHYGEITIVNVLITLCNVFVTSGMGSALVQKKEISERDYDTAFLISLLIAAVLYGLLFWVAPAIAAFYRMPVLKSVIRVMGLRLPLASINTIQQAKVQREMSFKRFFVATLFGTVLSGIVGILLAWRGFGVWALVAQYLTNTTVDTIVLFFVEKWIPRLRFSGKNAKAIFSFGWKVLATELVYTVEEDIRSLVVGKVFGSADLAFYDQGQKYPALLVNNLNAAINKVMLPAYSRSQEDLTQLKAMLRRSISLGVFLLAPLLVGFGAVSETFIRLILTDKWLPCMPFLQIFCVIYLTRPLETACHQALLAIGRSDVVLKIMVAINTVGLAAVLIATFLFHSVLLVAVGALISTVVSLCGFLYYTGKLLGYRGREQLADLFPALGCSLLMGAVVLALGRLPLNGAALLAVQVVTGGAVYGVLAKLLRLEAFSYLLGMLRKGTGKNGSES